MCVAGVYEMCMSGCAHVFMWTHLYHSVPVEVQGQPWVSVLTFHHARDRLSFSLLCSSG